MRPHRIVFVCLLMFSLCFQPFKACNLSDFSLTNVTYDSNTQEFVISTLLHVGSGRTGNVAGADDDTRTIAFGFYKSCAPITVNSFLPATLNAIYTGCNMPGTNLGPQGAPYNSQATIIYIDPGYYGNPQCTANPFGCITSTVNCGNVVSAPYNLVFRTSTIPDSIRVFGVEGHGNPLAGCYPDSDMKIDFCTQGYCSANIWCPGNQVLQVGANCTGVLPSYAGGAGFSYNCVAPPQPTITQSPTVGTTLSGLGTTTSVTLTAQFSTLLSANCSFGVTLVDLIPPVVTCPANATLQLGNNCQGQIPNYSQANATDNCSINSVTQSPATGTLLTAPGTTTVTLTATDGSGNTGTCSFTLTATAPSIFGTTTLSTSNPCVGDTVLLTATTGIGYLWNNGSTAASTIATSTGWYWVDVTLAQGCTARDSVFITFQPLPQPTLFLFGSQVCTGTYATYQWFLNGVPIPGATGPCTPISSNGSYTVQVTDSTGCGGIGGPLVLSGTADAHLGAFIVYPIPASDMLHVRTFQPINDPGMAMLYDLTGKMVRKWTFDHFGSEISISLQGLPEGTYLFELKSEGISGMKKVLKLQ
ncbi:MAG: hypothetical protein RLZZ519_423 [Bacteroidota bacterium]|jgi:hypothetical protein